MSLVPRVFCRVGIVSLGYIEWGISWKHMLPQCVCFWVQDPPQISVAKAWNPFLSSTMRTKSSGKKIGAFRPSWAMCLEVSDPNTHCGRPWVHFFPGYTNHQREKWREEGWDKRAAQTHQSQIPIALLSLELAASGKILTKGPWTSRGKWL